MPEVPEEDHRHRDAEGHVNHQESPRTDRDRPPNAHQSPVPSAPRDVTARRTETARTRVRLSGRRRAETRRSLKTSNATSANAAIAWTSSTHAPLASPTTRAIEARTDQDRDRDGEAPVDDAGRRFEAFERIHDYPPFGTQRHGLCGRRELARFADYMPPATAIGRSVRLLNDDGPARPTHLTVSPSLFQIAPFEPQK